MPNITNILSFMLFYSYFSFLLEAFNFKTWCGISHISVAMRPLNSASQTLMCLQITWGSCKDADLDLVGLGWSLRFCISNKFQVMLRILVPGPHFELQGTQSPLPQCQGSQGCLGIRINWGVFKKTYAHDPTLRFSWLITFGTVSRELDFGSSVWGETHWLSVLLKNVMLSGFSVLSCNLNCNIFPS